MTRSRASGAVLALATLCACSGGSMGPSPADVPAVATPAPFPVLPPLAARFVADLRRAGAVVGTAEVGKHPWIPVPRVAITIDDQWISAFEYETTEAVEDALRHTSADGHEFAGAQVWWISDPHIYRSDRLIVLYVGRSQPILDLLGGVLGPQIAGR